jgi:thioesterase domain-containing protein
MSLSERVEFLRLKTKVITNMLGVTRYTLKPYSGPIDVYFCEESFASPYKPNEIWQRAAAGEIQMRQLPGTHNDITGDHGVEISEDVMADLARQLTAQIEEILAKT